MTYSELLADRVRRRLGPDRISAEKKMMGGLIFMVNDKMCVGVDIDKTTGKDRLMVRVGKSAHEQLIFKRGSREMDFTGRVMSGFLFIAPDGFESDTDLDFWLEKALEFNSIDVR